MKTKQKTKTKSSVVKPNIRGVSKSLTNPDKTKKALCVFGPFDGKRIEFDNDKESFFLPIQGEKIRDGYYQFDNITYTSSTFKVNGYYFRVFHPASKTKDEVFQRLMDNYLGTKQVRTLKKKFNVPVEEIEKTKTKFK